MHWFCFCGKQARFLIAGWASANRYTPAVKMLEILRSDPAKSTAWMRVERELGLLRWRAVRARRG